MLSWYLLLLLAVICLNYKSIESKEVSSLRGSEEVEDEEHPVHVQTQTEQPTYTVGAYYYPWHTNNFHNGQGYLRRKLDPPQYPTLGEYDDTDPDVIAQHLKWSRYANINLWVASWWGPNGHMDGTLKNVILPHPDMNGMKIALFYETTGRISIAKQTNVEDVFYKDVKYIAKTYFDHPNYMRIDGRPVLFLYVTRNFYDQWQPSWLFGPSELEEITTRMRQAAMENGGHDLYIVGDQVWGDAPIMIMGEEYEPFTLLDAVTNYDVYGSIAAQDGYAGLEGVNDLMSRYADWKEDANLGGCAFIPGIAPGYNDRTVRTGNSALSRKLYEGAEEGSLFRTSLEKSLELTDQSTGNLIMITSWNEWHEDTQIEPVVIGQPKDPPLGTTCYNEPCDEGLEYDAYGELYLDIVRNVTSPTVMTDDFVHNSIEETEALMVDDKLLSLSYSPMEAANEDPLFTELV